MNHQQGLKKRIEIKRTMDLPKSEIWKVLADFPNIHLWNSGVKHSQSTCDVIEGIGAERMCKLAPFGQLDETIVEWVENELMVVEIHTVKGMPMKRALASFKLSGEEKITVTVDYRFQPSLIGHLMSPIIKMMLRKGFTGFLADLESAASK